MADPGILARIDAWAADGLIDEAVAGRLRDAEATRIAGMDDLPTERAGEPASPGGSPVQGFASIFGPGLAIGEMFGYLGAAFLLAAWHAFVLAGVDTADASSIRVFDALVPAIVLVLGGLWLRRESPRLRRAAGVAFAVATVHVAVAAWAAGTAVDPLLQTELVLLLAAVAGVAAAGAFRLLLPALMTQASLVGALWTLGFAATVYAEAAFLPPVDYSAGMGSVRPPDMAVEQAVLTAVWWIAVAVGIGLIGLREARIAAEADDEAQAAAASRRATLTRFGAGLVAVIGVASAVWTENGWDENGGIRALTPWLGDGVLLGLSAILVWLAIRGRSVYLYPAALGMVLALSDLNGRYVAPYAGAGPALFVEGVILLAVGVAAERLRRHASSGSLPAPLAV
ncbi:MAG TPA: hypothetical protein VIH37_00345 [Candidatus Limnocylindrales bacterium]